jgi:ABC-type uncharacterized transport system auxiliary subunit
MPDLHMKSVRCAAVNNAQPRVGESMKNLITFVLLAGLVAGCATSASPSLFTLNMTPSTAAGSPLNISVGRLRIAESLHNKRILIKKSPTEIEYYATAQWAANLDELLREKLAAEFGPIDTARDTYVLSGTLQAFEQIDMVSGNQAHVKLALEVRKEGVSQYSTPVIAKTYDVSLLLTDQSAGGVVEALSTCLETAARDIVADIAALQ